MDLYIFQLINGLAGKCPVFDCLGLFFAEYLGYVLILILAILLFKNFRGYFKMAAGALIAAILARFGIAELIRFLVPRSRPFVENSVNLLLNHEASLSFPSGHAATFFAVSTVVYYFNKKLGIWFFVSSFLISFFRVFCGVHWPSDILAGALVGLFSGWLVVKALKRIK
jgi:undecaprenyl-diphosphatase